VSRRHDTRLSGVSVATATTAKHTAIATHEAFVETVRSVLFSMRVAWILPATVAASATSSTRAVHRTGERRSRVRR